MSISDTPIQGRAAPQSPHRPVLQPVAEKGLYIVATPIGNLRDITLRALDVLASVDLILAEDTRRTRKLLSAYDIHTPLAAYHDHNAAKMIPNIIKKLEEGLLIAQVSDAGTPLVSDPGFKLVRACADAGQNVIPIPGASALLAGLAVAGLPSDTFLFAGFLPPKQGARRTRLETLKPLSATLVFFETAGRLKDVLSDMITIWGERSGVIARELTKTYEEIRRGSLTDLKAGLDTDPPRGEIVLLVGPPEQTDTWSDANIETALRDALPDMGVKRASAHVAELSGRPRRDIYKTALALK